MTIARPRIPVQLNNASDIVSILMDDDTVSALTASYIDLSGLRVASLALHESRFDHCNVSGLSANRTDVLDCSFANCDFAAAKFDSGSMQRVQISNSRASGIQLQDSVFKDISFDTCKLNLANFRMGTLRNILFKNCDLSEADFYGASLHGVRFDNCSLNKASLSRTKLVDVDLRASDIFVLDTIDCLEGAIIDSQQLLSIAFRLATVHKIKVRDD